MFVLGEAGLGKSALVERFTAGCGARLAFGQCIEHYGSGEPYMPVLDAPTRCAARGRGRRGDAMRIVAPTWLLQLPWFVGDDDRRNLQREAAGATQDRMLREFGELIDRARATNRSCWSWRTCTGATARRYNCSPTLRGGAARPR